MRKIGNAISNRVFNPKNTQPSVPLDVDEVDAAMERFIRQKYDQRAFAGGKTRVPATRAPVLQHTGSSDDQPPPPPPKPGRRFGFGLRSASSALPLSKNFRDSPPPTPDFPKKGARSPSPIRMNKQSRVFGASIGLSEDGMEWKLLQLKEMGFPDDKRNTNILKGLNGDLERAIESLVRLGEGITPISRTRTPVSARFPDVSRPDPNTGDTRTQQAFGSQPATTGFQLQKPPQTQKQSQTQLSAELSPPVSAKSYNPFENLDPPSAPFQQASLENAFQNMQVTQPLFPNNTGGYPNQQQQLQQARIQQSMTPPVPQVPHQFTFSNPYTAQPIMNYNPFISQMQQQQQQQQQQQIQPLSAGPFLPSQQTFKSQNPYQAQTSLNGVLSQPSLNPYQQQSSTDQFQQTVQTQFQQVQQLPQQQPSQQQPPQQQQSQQWPQQQVQTQYQESPQQMFSPQSFIQPVQLPSYPLTYQNPYQQPTQPLVPQQTGRYDKSSILALYNYTQLAPPPLVQDTSGSNTTDSLSPPQPPAANLPQGVSGVAQRSATMPALSFLGNKNPFLNPAGPTQMNPGSQRVSQDYTDAGGLQNGRHSPDAFASLSARFPH